MSLKQMQILDSTEAVKQERPAPCARHCEANAFKIVIKNLKAQLAQPEQEPVAWLLIDKNINSLQVDSIQRLIDRLKHAHHTDIRVRINGHDEWFEADWLKHMVRVIPSQPEQNPMSDEMLQAITDSENQPSQYGTVTLDYHFEKIKKWEDLFERMSNKVLQQLEQEPVAWADLNALSEQINSVNCGTVYGLPSKEENRQPLYTTPPQRKPLTQDGTMEIANQTAGQYWMDEAHIQRFRAAVEAAHGIKENT